LQLKSRAGLKDLDTRGRLGSGALDASLRAVEILKGGNVPRPGDQHLEGRLRSTAGQPAADW